MAVSIVGGTDSWSAGTKKIDEGMILHSMYVHPFKSNQDVGSKLFRHAHQLTKTNNQYRLIVKAFSESIEVFKKIGFTSSDILDYPNTLEIAV
jgi:GNAT superfamily N-acetyltransferase